MKFFVSQLYNFSDDQKQVLLIFIYLFQKQEETSVCKYPYIGISSSSPWLTKQYNFLSKMDPMFTMVKLANSSLNLT